MLDHVCKDSQEYEKISNFNVLQEILLENIRNKRFLLVLDDMWEDKDKSGWDKLLAPLKHNQVTGCMVLATTRRNSVARMIGTMDAIKLNGLDEKEFWLFFKACAFGNENYEGHPSLQSIGQQIAKALKGCPLAARSVGALLNRNVSYEHWRTVQYKWKYLQQEDDDILPILKLSYDYLPFHLQRCFSYCSLFPKDHRFNGEVLVRAWISQNFVQCEDTIKGLEETGRQYLNSLVDFGFFQMVDSHYAMHDLMHELAEKVSSNECVTINGLQSKTIKPCIHHLSIITTGRDRDEHANFLSENFEKILQMIRPLQKLRTLMFFGQSSVHLLRSFPTLCEEAKTLRLLRVYATGADVGSILSILKPYHLRYLEFVCVSTSILAYPVDNNTAFPQALTGFYHLQTLHLENYREWRILGSLEMLPLLRKLTLVRMWNLTEVSIPSLEELVLVKMPKLEKCIGTDGLELTSRLRVLMVKDCPKLNEFTLSQSDSSFQAEQKSRFPSLTKLTIGHCPHIIKREILPLEEMRALKELELMDVHGVRVLSVPSLEKLVLIKMPSLESCSGLTASPPLQISPSHGEQKEWVSSLRTLIICDCPNLIVSHPLPPSVLISELSIKGLPTFPTMKMSWRQLTIESNELSVLDDKILAFHNLRGITSLNIENCPNLVSLPCEYFSQLTTLQTLRINNCPNLLKSHIMSESVQEDITSANSLVLPSLKSLFIWSCGIAGGCLTQMLLHLLSLEELTLSDCPQIKLISISQPTEVEETDRLASAATVVASSAQDELVLKMPSNLLPSLKRLRIYNFRDLEFCGGKGGFRGFTSLEELHIHRDCPKLLLGEMKDDGTVDETLLPPSLQELRISSLPANMHSYFPIGLKKLCLDDSPYLKCVQLHSCTVLEELRILWCPQLAVLEGLQFLGSLRSLEIEMNPELSAAWDLKLQEQGQGGNQIGLLPPSLGRLVIRNLTDEVQSRMLSCLPRITKLEICSSPILTSLQLEYCTALEELEIRYCGSLASIEGLHSIRNLRLLGVDDSPSLPPCLELLSQQQGASEIWSRLETLKIGDASVLTMSLCKEFTSLRRLEFWSGSSKHRESMVSLTEEQDRALQLLTSLQQLRFRDYQNLLSLPANLRSLASLEMLDIFCCPSIARLPEMGLPPSLKQLYVYHCSEELSMQCRMAATEKLSVTIRN